MTAFNNTFASGQEAEDTVADIVANYTSTYWRNVRIETCLGATGNTEIDLVCIIGDCIHVIESKNVASIVGSYGDMMWTLTGSKDIHGSDPYSALNIIVQNNLHVSALLDVYYDTYKEYPPITACIVVPDNCEVSDDILGEVIRQSNLPLYLAEMKPLTTKLSSTLKYRLCAIISSSEEASRAMGITVLNRQNTGDIIIMRQQKVLV